MDRDKWIDSERGDGALGSNWFWIGGLVSIVGWSLVVAALIVLTR